MKRVFQFAAMVVVLLLAAQPALAGVACATGGMARAACPMGMSEMGSDCPMAYGLAADCTRDCCDRTTTKAVVLPAAPIKPRTLVASAVVSTAVEPPISAVLRADWLAPMAVSSSPPHYLLNRVFRI